MVCQLVKGTFFRDGFQMWNYKTNANILKFKLTSLILHKYDIVSRVDYTELAFMDKKEKAHILLHVISYNSDLSWNHTW